MVGALSGELIQLAGMFLLSPRLPRFCSFICSYDTSVPEAYWDPQDESHRVRQVRVPNYFMGLQALCFSFVWRGVEGFS